MKPSKTSFVTAISIICVLIDSKFWYKTDESWWYETYDCGRESKDYIKTRNISRFTFIYLQNITFIYYVYIKFIYLQNIEIPLLHICVSSCLIVACFSHDLRRAFAPHQGQVANVCHIVETLPNLELFLFF